MKICHYGFISSQNRLENAKTERIKIIVPFRSVPTSRVIENSKIKAKEFKKLKNTIMASFHDKMGWTMPRK